MKCTIIQEDKFIPINLKISIESTSELYAFKQLLRRGYRDGTIDEKELVHMIAKSINFVI